MHFKRYNDVLLAPERVVDQFSDHKPFHPKASIRGEIKLVLRDLNGRYLTETPWEPNLITDYGVQLLMTSGSPQTGWLYKHIGSSAIAPVYSQTALTDWMAVSAYGAQAGTMSNEEAMASNDYTAWWQEAHRVSGGAGTIRQIGISGANTNQDMIIVAQVTTPLAKTIDQVVDVYHRFYQQYDTTDQTGVVNIAGDDFNYTAGMYRLEYTASRSARIACRPYGGYDNHFYSNVKLREDGDHRAWGFIGDGLGSVESDDGDNAVGFVYDHSNIATLGYSSVTVYANVGLTECNVPGSVANNGIKGLLLQFQSDETLKVGLFVALSKVSDGTGLFKDDTQTLRFYYGSSFGRAGTLIP